MDPTEVTAEVLRRLEGTDWMGVAELHSVDFLAHFKSVRLSRWSAPSKPIAVETLMANDPEMPLEVAEYHVERARRAPPRADRSRFGLETGPELEELSPAEVYGRHLKAEDWRTSTQQYLELIQDKYPQYADQLEEEKKLLWRPWRIRILGQVIDGLRAYVIYTEGSAPGPDHPWDFPPPVVSLRSTDGGWRVSCDLTQVIGGGLIAAVVVKNEAGETIHLSL